MIDGEIWMTAEKRTTTIAGDPSPIGYVIDVIDSADFIKTGRKRGLRHAVNTRSFSAHRARAINISDFSFPTFIIRRPKESGDSLPQPRTVGKPAVDEEDL